MRGWQCDVLWGGQSLSCWLQGWRKGPQSQEAASLNELERRGNKLPRWSAALLLIGLWPSGTCVWASL